MRCNSHFLVVLFLLDIDSAILVTAEGVDDVLLLQLPNFIQEIVSSLGKV